MKMTDETTTIEISVENWQWLSSLKQRPGDSFDDVVSRLRIRAEADELETATIGDEPGEMTADAGEALFGDLDEER